MKIGILGTGMVGQAIASKLAQIGHEVRMGARSAANEKAAAFVKGSGARASQGTFAEAAAFGEVVFNCTSGAASLAALALAGAGSLKGKILIDVANPLDFSRGRPPRLSVCNDDSLGEQIQRAFPETRVEKSLNTMNCTLMVNPALVPGAHDVFVSGDDPQARAAVAGYLKDWFGWQSVVDLGDMKTARGVEMILPLWVQLMGVVGSPMFNFRIVR